MNKNKISKPIFLVLLLLLIPSVLALLKPGYYNMHDDMQMVRQLELEKCIQDGQIPCRWSPDLGYEYGYPLFNFYPPLPYIVGQIYRFLGFSFMWSVKLTAVTQFITSGIAMYLFVSYLSTPLISFLASLFYTYAPYHAVNVYIRGAMNEAWASVFFPLIFVHGLIHIVTEKDVHGVVSPFGIDVFLGFNKARFPTKRIFACPGGSDN